MRLNCLLQCKVWIYNCASCRKRKKKRKEKIKKSHRNEKCGKCPRRFWQESRVAQPKEDLPWGGRGGPGDVAGPLWRPTRKHSCQKEGVEAMHWHLSNNSSTVTATKFLHSWLAGLGYSWDYSQWAEICYARGRERERERSQKSQDDFPLNGVSEDKYEGISLQW